MAWGFFFTAFAIAASGPGAIAAVALVAPIAMPLGRRSGVPDFLCALMVANGANAGNLSAFSAVGIVANSKMAVAGLGGHESAVFVANFGSHLLVSAVAFVALGGLRLSARTAAVDAGTDRLAPLTVAQWCAVGVIAAWIAGVTLLRLPLGLSAFAAATLLILSRAVVETVAVTRMPWGIILMVCGVSTLIALVEKTGGMTLFTTLLSTLATPSTVYGVMAFVTGVISTYSSTSGVVLPTFLPTVPGLVAQVGGGDPLALALSINVGVVARGRVAALDPGCAVRRRRGRPRRRPRPLSPVAHLGPVDDRRRRPALSDLRDPVRRVSGWGQVSGRRSGEMGSGRVCSFGVPEQQLQTLPDPISGLVTEVIQFVPGGRAATGVA